MLCNIQNRNRDGSASRELPAYRSLRAAAKAFVLRFVKSSVLISQTAVSIVPVTAFLICASAIAFVPAPLIAQIVPISQEPSLPSDYPLVTTPLQCLAAVTREHQLIWRKGERDTIPFGSSSDTLPTIVTQRARRCAAQFSLSGLVAERGVPGLTERDIFPLLRLYLVAGWDDSVRAAIEPLIANSAMTSRDSLKRQDIVLLRIVDAFLTARPLRLSDGQRYADRIDLLGPHAAVSRLRAHKQLVDAASNIGDTASLTRNIRAALSAAADIPARDRGLEYDRIRSVYYAAISAADVMKDSVMAREVMTSFSELVEALLTNTPDLPDTLREFLSPQLPNLRGWLSSGYANAAGAVRELESVRAEHWYSEDGKAIPPIDSTVPTLVLKINPHRCNGLRCDRSFAMLDRLAKAYQPRGVQVILLVSMAGYLHLDVFDQVADEVKAVRAYVQDTLKLPGVLAISESSFVTRPDGRIQQVPKGNEAYGLGWFVLRDGVGRSHTKAFGFLSDRLENEVWMRIALDRMLAK